MGLCWGYTSVVLGLDWGYIGVIGLNKVQGLCIALLPRGVRPVYMGSAFRKQGAGISLLYRSTTREWSCGLLQCRSRKIANMTLKSI